MLENFSGLSLATAQVAQNIKQRRSLAFKLLPSAVQMNMLIRSELHLVMQFQTAIHRYLSINNAFTLRNLMSFTYP